MSGQVINYQGNIFIFDVLANAIHCPAFSCGPSSAGGNSKTLLLSLRFYLINPCLFLHSYSFLW